MSEAPKPDSISRVKRGIWFFMRTVLIAAVLLALFFSVFVYAMRASNLYILAVEGMQLRAECVLASNSQEALSAYFTPAFLAEDAALTQTPYADYTIKSYDYRVEVEDISVWPWSSSASVTVVDKMHALTGELHEDKRPADAKDAAFPPPEWAAARYILRFRMKDDRFYITQIQFVEEASQEDARPTPDMSKTPVQAATPTPTPLKSPALSPAP